MPDRLRAEKRSRCAILVALAFLAIGILGQPLRAGAIPGVSTLQDLIDRGSAQSSGVQTGGDLFYNFTYSLSPAGGAPGASQIFVTFTDSGPGLRFSSDNWSSGNGNNVSSLVGYSVHVADAPPASVQQEITSAILDFQSTVSPASPADNASVTESLGDNNGHVPFAQLTAFNPGGTTVGGPPNTKVQAINPGLRDFGVSSDLTVHSGAGSAGSATVTYFDNIFGNSAVPEPAALSLLALGAIPMLVRRRRK